MKSWFYMYKSINIFFILYDKQTGKNLNSLKKKNFPREQPVSENIKGRDKQHPICWVFRSSNTTLFFLIESKKKIRFHSEGSNGFVLLSKYSYLNKQLLTRHCMSSAGGKVFQNEQETQILHIDSQCVCYYWL